MPTKLGIQILKIDSSNIIKVFFYQVAIEIFQQIYENVFV